MNIRDEQRQFSKTGKKKTFFQVENGGSEIQFTISLTIS